MGGQREGGRGAGKGRAESRGAAGVAGAAGAAEGRDARGARARCTGG
jgi:hypothetical protein